jgi:hypothetical protein
MSCLLLYSLQCALGSRTFLQESGDKSTETEHASRSKSDAAGGRVSGAGGLGSAGARSRRAGLLAGRRRARGRRIIIIVRGRRTARRRCGGGGASLSASASNNRRVRSSADDNGSGGSNADLEGCQAAGDVLHDVGDAHGQAGGDGSDFGLRGDGCGLGCDGGGEGGLVGCDGGHAGDYAEGVGLCEVGGEAVGVGGGGGLGVVVRFGSMGWEDE